MRRMSSGRWEDCPCCGAATFPDGSTQWDGTRVPCGCDCWVSVDYDEPVGYIAMGDGPCSFYALCSREEHWETEARRAHAQPTPGYTPAVRRVVAWVPETSDDVCWSADEAYAEEADSRLRDCLVQRGREDYWTWRDVVGDEHAMRVQARWAAILQAQDRKHGGGS